MAKRIPAKQVVRAGTKSDLREKLIDRELGFEPTEFMLYVKYGDEIYPAGAVSIPAPGTNSVYMGKEDGTMDWANLPATSTPYDTELKVYESLDGVPFGAAFAYKDSEGHLIGSNAYFSSRVPPVYGPFKITNEEVSYFRAVRIGDSDTILGGLIPATPPVEDSTFRKGDILFVDSFAGTPHVRWVHPESTPVQDSVQPVTSGAVYKVRFLIDPNLYDPNEDEDLPITGESASSYRVGYYYIVGDTLYRCESRTSSSALLTRVDGVVTALNELAGKLQAVKVAIYYFEADTKVCRDVGGNIVSGSTILNALAGGSVPILIIRSTRGGTVICVANITNGGTTVEFQTIPDEYGRFVKYSISDVGTTWTVTEKTIAKDTFVAEYGVTTKEELDTAISLNKTIVMPSVSFDNNLVMDLVFSSRKGYDPAPYIYTFTSGVSDDGSYGEVTLNYLGVWTKTVKSLRGYNLGNIVDLLGDESEQTLLTHVPCFRQAGYDFTLKVFSSANAEVIRMYSSEARTFRIVGRRHILRTLVTNPLEEWSNVDITLDVPSSSGYATFNLADHQAMIESTTTVILDAVIVVGGQTYGNLKITSYPSGDRHYLYASYDGLE